MNGFTAGVVSVPLEASCFNMVSPEDRGRTALASFLVASLPGPQALINASANVTRHRLDLLEIPLRLPPGPCVVSATGLGASPLWLYFPAGQSLPRFPYLAIGG